MLTPTRPALAWIAAFLTVVVCQSVCLHSAAAAETFPGKKSEWHGFDRFDFEVDSRQCIVVTPKAARR